MAAAHTDEETKAIFETMPISRALLKMAVPTITSQLITLVYNVADTWFIGQTDNPYMVAASYLIYFRIKTEIDSMPGLIDR